MRSCGIKHIKEIYRPEDPISEGKYKGFVLLVFSNHVDAMSAFQRLRKHDAIFGCGRSARVAFARSSMHPSDESLLQVRWISIWFGCYIDNHHLPSSSINSNNHGSFFIYYVGKNSLY